jgi:hypothetical protein
MPNSNAKRLPPFALPRFSTVFIAGMLLALCLLLLFPQTMAFEAIVNWLLIITVIGLLVKTLRGDPKETHRERPRQRTEPRRHGRIRHVPASPPSWSVGSDWLGPFNPDDGFSLRASPHFIREDDDSITTTFSDPAPWD